ncbi:MAG: hypothetical protein ACKOW5_15565 [Actinomycetales bacterium]
MGSGVRGMHLLAGVTFAIALSLSSVAVAAPSDAFRRGVTCAESAATLDFAGRTWQVKRSKARVGPGPNLFVGANVCIGPDGLHLRIARDSRGRWASAEVYLPQSLGYGRYTWTLSSRVDRLNAQAVLGLFTYASDTEELDIEFARWGWAKDPTNAQYVVQPWDRPGNLHRFTLPPVRSTTHSFTWLPGAVSYASAAADGSWSYAWEHASSDVPIPEPERVHMNLWLYQGKPLAEGARVAEAVISDFAFTPAAGLG